jgi:signal transduction histidine kinase
VILFCMGLLSLVLAVFVIRERLAHRRAEETRGQLREAIESLPGGFALFDRDERLVLCNSAYAQVFPGLDHELRPGIAFERLLRKAVQADCIDHEGGGAEKWISERLAAFRFPTRAIETRTRDGRCHRIAERRTADGGVVAIATDITALRRRETELERLGAELQQKNRMLDVALGNMAQGLAMFDGEQRLVVANQRFLELLDLPPELGRPGVELAEVVRVSAERRRSPASDIEELVRHRLEMARHRGELWHREVHVDGRVIEVFHRPIASGGSVATYDDVSDEHYAELQLLEAKERAEIANRAKSEFLANVSHELRTPLNAIIGFSDIIARELFGPIGNDSYRAYAKDIHDSGSHLLGTISDILDLSTLETGKLVLRDSHLDLTKAVQTAVETLQEQARQAEVTVDIGIPPSLPLLRVDHRSLQQIVGNLLANAIKFSHAGGRVEISASYREDQGIVLAIADQGPGIAPEHLETALAPFGQVQHPLVRQHGGTGLGLPLSRHLVNLHDGELSIESRVGEGTTVLVQFPPARITPRGRRPRVSETG